LYLALVVLGAIYTWLFLLGVSVPVWRKVFMAALTGGIFVLVWLVFAPANRLLDLLVAVPSLLVAALGVPRARARLLSLRRTEPVPPLTDVDAVLVAIGFLVVSWIFLTISDRVIEPSSTWQRKAPAAAQVDASQWPNARLGIALSGGGYRAALFHAGVLSAL